MQAIPVGQVAEVWQQAVARRVPPTKAVQEHFALPARTASHWVKKARDQGLIPSEPVVSARYRSGQKLDAVAAAIGVDPEVLAAAIIEHANGDLRLR